MSQDQRSQEMVRMLRVLSTGFKLVGRAFRAFEQANNQLVEQYTLTDHIFPVSIHSILHSFPTGLHLLTEKDSESHTARSRNICQLRQCRHEHQPL